MLRIILLLLVSCSVGSSEPRTEQACYGSSYKLFSDYAAVFRYAKLFFTPNNPRGARKLVMENRQVTDPRYKTSDFDVIVLEVTEKDEGTFSVMYTKHSKITDIIKLKVKDCSTKEFKQYGDSYSLKIPRNAESLDLTPLMSPDQPRLLWNRTSPKTSTGSRGQKMHNNWMIKNLNPVDNGYYTFRSKDQRFISRTKFTVTERTESYEKKVTENFQISFAVLLNPTLANLDFLPGSSSERFTLMRAGVLLDNSVWSPISELMLGRLERVSSVDPRRGIVIYDLQVSDSGRYEVRDENGTLALIVNLLVLEVAPTSLYISVAVTIVFMVVFCCCCVRKCCCKKSASKRSDPVSQTVIGYTDDTSQPSGLSYPASTPAPTNYYRPTRYISPTEPISSPSEPPPDTSQPSGQRYLASTPAPTNYHHPTRYISPTEPISSSFELPPAAGLNGEAPTTSLGSDYLSLDPDPQFVLKGLNFLTAPPLSSDTAFCDVYTSDKLNFN